MASLPQPPVDMVMPEPAQAVVTVALILVSMGLGAAAIVRWRRSGSPTLLLVMVGAFLASIAEAPITLLGLAFHARIGQWTAYEAFGRSIPAWMPFAYLICLGALPYYLARLLGREGGQRALWVALGVIALVNVTIEVPATNLGLYRYYGEQPLKLGGYPLLWLFMNTTTILVITVIIWAGSSGFFAGRRTLLLLGMPFAAVTSVTMTVGMPLFSVLNTSLPTTARYVGLAVSLSASVGIIRFLSTLIVSKNERDRTHDVGGSVLGANVSPDGAPADA